MKANAPEKFYTDENGLFPMSKRNSDSDIEYVRTDAFIEKAADYLFNNMRCDRYTLQTKLKFIKGFKNYLEGG